MQDIPTLNGQDSSQLEDWLTDIETASELTGESRTKLAQAKSRGLVRTLISEALTSQKTWEEIKDSLHLKISNADIHTSISHFMDIQQSDKESLAAYVHQFKQDANRCKFNNDDTATIRIFLKGLQNAHTLATKVYEKGPQSLADTIKEVEKLQAAQQITSTLLPSSLVNTMSSDNDKCFQCQETSHMACYCAHNVDNGLIATIMDMLQQIALTRYLLQACQHDAAITPLVVMIGQHLRTATPDATIETGTDSADLNLAHTTPDIEVTVIVITAEAILDHFIDLHAIAPCISEVPAHTATAMTHHITDPHHIDIYPEETVDPEHISPAGNIINQHKDHLPVHKQCLGNIRTEGTNRSQLTILPQNIIAQMNRIVT